jgi:hypothetical protein
MRSSKCHLIEHLPFNAAFKCDPISFSKLNFKALFEAIEREHPLRSARGDGTGGRCGKWNVPNR